MTDENTPILSPDGQHYCSPRCGAGKFCRKEWYDRAVAEADALAEKMGEGWRTEVWENLGWHYRVVNRAVTIHAHVDRYGKTPTRYSAWIEPGFSLGRQTFQIIEYADDPEDALGIAKQKAWEVISRIRESISELEAYL